jgi:hypothetical protein
MKDLSSAYSKQCRGVRIMETRGGNRAVALELFLSQQRSSACASRNIKNLVLLLEQNNFRSSNQSHSFYSHVRRD